MAEYENTAIVETEPTGPESEPSRNWIRLVIMIIAAVIVAALLIFAARWIYHAVTDDDSNTGTSGQVDDNDILPAGPDKEGASNPAKPGTLPGTQPSTRTPQTGDQLPSSGPEHIAAVFAGSSLVGAGVHYFVNRKRND